MAYKHSNAIREMDTRHFDSSTQRFIMIELAHMADNSGIIRHSQIELATLTLLSRVTIANEMKKLEDKKLILKETYGKYKVNILLEKQRAPEAESAKDEELGPDDEKHRFELWSAKHTVDLEEGTFILVSDEDTSTDAEDYKEQGLIKRIADEAMLHKDGYYYVYERTSQGAH